MTPFQIQHIKETKRRTLTRKQAFWRYWIVALVFICGVFIFFNPREYTYTGRPVLDFLWNHFLGILLILISVVTFINLKRTLRFKTINISVTREVFKKSISQTAKEMEWEIDEEINDVVTARSSIVKKRKGWQNASGQLITIIWCSDKILFNSLEDPEKNNKFSAASMMNKWNRKVFERYLKQNAANIGLSTSPQ